MPVWPQFVLLGLFALAFVSVAIVVTRLQRFIPPLHERTPDAGFALFSRLWTDEALHLERKLFLFGFGCMLAFIVFMVAMALLVPPAPPSA